VNPSPQTDRMLELLAGLTASVRRIADRLDPPADAVVGTSYVAKRLGHTTIRISEMIRRGDIASCVVQGTGNGRVWKLHREKVERWLASR
jgi:hypothetical protein